MLQSTIILRAAKRLTPTDVAQYVRLGDCARYLKLRLHERKKGSKFLREYGVAPQAIPPLLTHSGQRFEEQVEGAARRKFAVIHCGKSVGAEEDTGKDASDGEARMDNLLVIDQARSLSPGATLLLFQPRLQSRLGEWDFVGDVDILRLDRDADGSLSALIVDMKSTTRPKLEHRLQVAFYHRMLTDILGGAGVALARVEIGVLYRGPAQGSRDLVPAEERAEREAADTLLGVRGALLEVIPRPEDYLHEVEDLVAGPEAVVTRIARTRHDAAFFHLSYKCDGCLYSEWCMKAAFQQDDLSLIPTLTASEKRTLHAAGLTTSAEVAGLMELTDAPGRGGHLVPTPGREETIRSLRASSVGPRLHEIVHRARQVARSRQRELKNAQERRDQAAECSGAGPVGEGVAA